MNPSIEELSEKILEFITRKPAYFLEILRRFEEADYRHILLAWSKLRSQGKLGREEATGKYRANAKD